MTRRRLGWASVTALAMVVALVSAAPALADSWGPAFSFAGPVAHDLLHARLSFSPSGAAALAYAQQDEDQPADAQAFTVSRSVRGAVADSRQVPGVQQVLDLGFDGRTLELLTGGSEAGQACCSTAQVISTTGGSFSRPQTITKTLAGPTTGRLVTLPHHVTLAALASARGVWVAQSGRAGGLTKPHRLTGASAMPQTLAAGPLAGGRSVVAWTTTGGQAGAANPRTIAVAYGSATKAPAASGAAVGVPRGHEVDELQLAGGTLAWIESWYDAKTGFHSSPLAADLPRASRPRSFAVGGQAAGLAATANPRGDLLLAWKACSQSGSCTVYAASRAAGRRFGSAQKLGPIDASQEPAVAVGGRGEGLVGWIDQGHVYAADRRRAGSSFGPARQVSATSYAADLTLAFSSSGGAVAAWTQGTLNVSVMGAVHRSS